MHIIENEYLRVSIADAGAELTSVKTGSIERIWTADPAVWNRHAPILFPFVGKSMDGKYRIGNVEYPMATQHGFARDMGFACIEETPTSVKHELTSSEWTRERYPYDFRLTVLHRVDRNRLFIEWTIENTGARQMFFSIGGHPGFLLPAGIRKEDCFIMFPGCDELHYVSANPAGYAVKDQKTLHLQDSFIRYQEDIPNTWIFEDGQVKEVGIALPDKKPFAILHCDQFPMLAVWANPNGPFICLEPWLGRTDDDGFSGSIEEKKGIQRLKAGEGKVISYSIEFCKYNQLKG